MTMIRTAAGAALLLLAGCAYEQQPMIAGQSGLAWQMQRFYLDHATEDGGMCPRPRMNITSTQVVEETPEQVVMRVRYHWQDDSFRRVPDPMEMVIAGGCAGFATRDFTLARMTDDTLQVVGMSGERRNVRQNFGTGSRPQG